MKVKKRYLFYIFLFAWMKDSITYIKKKKKRKRRTKKKRYYV